MLIEIGRYELNRAGPGNDTVDQRLLVSARRQTEAHGRLSGVARDLGAVASGCCGDTDGTMDVLIEDSAESDGGISWWGGPDR